MGFMYLCPGIIMYYLKWFNAYNPKMQISIFVQFFCMGREKSTHILYCKMRNSHIVRLEWSQYFKNIVEIIGRVSDVL